jgi:hypothetical protein
MQQQQMGPPHVAGRESCIDFDFLELTIRALQSSTKASAGKHPQSHMSKGWCFVVRCNLHGLVHGNAKPGSTVALNSPVSPIDPVSLATWVLLYQRFTFVAAFSTSPP